MYYINITIKLNPTEVQLYSKCLKNLDQQIIFISLAMINVILYITKIISIIINASNENYDMLPIYS